MPKTAAGSTILTKMMSEYGAKKGKGIFYKKSVKDKKFAKTAGETSVYNRAHK